MPLCSFTYSIFSGLLALALVACNGANTGGPVVDKPSGGGPSLANAAAQFYTLNSAIRPLSVTNSGNKSLVKCSADSLPTGLKVTPSADRSSCEIIGAPTTPQVATTHKITAHYTFGESDASVVITVLAETSFVTTWKTDNPGTSEDNQITITTSPKFSYNYQVNWGDGQVDHNITGNITHTYAAPGIYTVEIAGDFPQTYFFDYGEGSDPLKLLTIKQWGNQPWRSMEKAFQGCLYLILNAKDIPDLSRVTNTSSMFKFADLAVFNEDIGSWDVSSVTNMERMFATAQVFNQDINRWDVSSVTNMNGMFLGAYSFNQNLSAWDVSSVNDIASMFEGAKIFNQDISGWNVSSVINMANMFREAEAFNQAIGDWDVTSVASMGGMFWGVTLSVAHYDALLIGWSSRPLKSEVSFAGGNSQYSINAQAARDKLTSPPLSWVISDGGLQ